jgi:hypothetical protein
VQTALKIALAAGGAALAYAMFAKPSVGADARVDDFVLVPLRNLPDTGNFAALKSEIKPELRDRVSLIVRVTSADASALTGQAMGVVGDVPGQGIVGEGAAIEGPQGIVTIARSAIVGIMKRGRPVDLAPLQLEEGAFV